MKRFVSVYNFYIPARSRSDFVVTRRIRVRAVGAIWINHMDVVNPVREFLRTGIREENPDGEAMVIFKTAFGLTYAVAVAIF